MPSPYDRQFLAPGSLPGHYDFADFAQEFLRRNDAYRQAYHRLTGTAEGGRPGREDEMEGLARLWGLSFPLRS